MRQMTMMSNKSIYNDNTSTVNNNALRNEDNLDDNPVYQNNPEEDKIITAVYPSGPSSAPKNHDQIQDKSMNDSTYIVDPANIDVIPIVDGEIVPMRRCFLSNKLNPKLHALLLGLLTVAVATSLGTLLTDSTEPAPSMPVDNHVNFAPSISPSDTPSTVLSIIPSTEPIDMRLVNITKVLLGVSGDIMLQQDSPQNKAYTWIIEKDGMNLTYSSPNLVQRYTSMVLYHSLIGEEWIQNAGYGSDTHECDWFGIDCYSNKLLKNLSLEINNLQGQIPKEIGTLAKLVKLDFSKNRIGGTIPSEIGKLQSIEMLRLTENMISGTIPNEIGNCRKLYRLAFRANKLTGSIPSSIGNLRFLQRLSLRSNQFSGSIPSDLSKPSNLLYIDLSENKLTNSIPAELGSLTVLGNLEFSENRLVGTIPPSFGNLESIRVLSLHDNLLTGTIPSNLNQCTKLACIQLNNNFLSSTIHTSIGSMSSLERINLSWNDISGTIPSEIGNLDNLFELKLHQNAFIGQVPGEICELSMRQVTADCANSTSGIVCSCCTLCY